MADSDLALIATPQEFGRWIQDHHGRHVRVSEHECTCGWYLPEETDPVVTDHSSHFNRAFFTEIGAVIPSGISSLDGTGVLSWRGALRQALSLLAKVP